MSNDKDALPSSEGIHSCSYFCERPGCVKAQRDALVKRFIDQRSDAEDAVAMLEWVFGNAGEIGIYPNALLTYRLDYYDADGNQRLATGESAIECVRAAMSATTNGGDRGNE